MAGASLKKQFNAGKRFGPRYGRKLRQKYIGLENQKNASYKCPSCRYERVFRYAVGIWGCKKCNAKFTGRAYSPQIKAKISVTAHEQFGLSEAHLKAAEEKMAKSAQERERKKAERLEAKRVKEQAELEQKKEDAEAAAMAAQEAMDQPQVEPKEDQ